MKSPKTGEKVNEPKSSQCNPQSLQLGAVGSYLTANKRSLQQVSPTAQSEESKTFVGSRKMDSATRRRVMSSIRKTDTVPELVLRRALYAVGLRGWRCHRHLPGTPDVTFTRGHIVVFVDGVWWHGHPDYLPRGRRGPYWDAKIAGNAARDTRINRVLEDMGWTVVRIWDLEVLNDPIGAAHRVATALKHPRATVSKQRLEKARSSH